MAISSNPPGLSPDATVTNRRGQTAEVQSRASEFQALMAAPEPFVTSSLAADDELPLLLLGSHNADVELLQRALNSLGFDAGTPDSQFGRLTDGAVREFQEDAELTVDGKVGDKSWQALYDRMVDLRTTLIRFGESSSPEVTELTSLISAMRPRLPGGPTDDPGNGVHSSLPLLGNGSAGAAVKLLQESLNMLGYGSGEPDSAFGPNTDAAVRRFQSANGLSRDGLVGTQTWGVLRQDLREALSDADPATIPEFQRLIGQIENGVTETPREPGPEPRGIATLRIGSQGNQVELLQNTLNALSFDSGTADGAFGVRTDTAVRNFQSASEIAVDGLVGRNTWAELKDATVDLRASAIRENRPFGVIDYYSTIISDIDRLLDGELGLGAMDPGEILSDPNFNPEFAKIVSSILHELAAQGYKPRVVSGFRSFEEQDYLYSLGRTRSGSIVTNAQAGESWHNYGLGVDIALQGPDAYPDPSPFWDALGRVANSYDTATVDLVWGGEWNSPDRPHLELHPGRTASQAGSMINTYQSGGLNAVWDELGLDTLDLPPDPREQTANRILDRIDAETSPLKAFQRLQSELDGQTSAVKKLVLADPLIDDVIEDASLLVRRAVDNETRRLLADTGGFETDYVMAKGSTQIAAAAFDMLDDLILNDEDPEATALLLERLDNSLDTIANRVENARLDHILTGVDDYDVEVLKTMEGIFGHVRNAADGPVAVTQLAALASDMWVGRTYSALINASQSDGAGRLRNEFALEVERYRDANGIGIPRDSLEAAINSMSYFADSDLMDAEQEYYAHAGELQFLVSQFSAMMTPGQLDAAIADYIEQAERREPGWTAREEQLRDDLSRMGESYLLQADALWNSDLPADLLARIDLITQKPAVQTAIIAFLDNRPNVLERMDIGSILTALSTVKYAGSGYALANKVATTYVHQGLGESFLAMKTVNSRANIDRVLAQLDDLEANASVLSKILTRENNIPQFRAGLNVLREAMENPQQKTIEQLLEQTQSEYDRLSIFNKNKPLGRAFRGFGGLASVIGGGASLNEAINNPSVENWANAAVNSLGALPGGVSIYNSITGGSSRLFGATWYTKSLGVASVALTLVDMGRDLRNGDYANAGFAFAGATGTTLALFAGTGSWAGPVGTGVAVTAALGQIGYNQWLAVRASNDFTGEEAVRFLDHSDLNYSASQSLVDRSGKGFSPVVAFLMYGDQQGWDKEQTISWINNLDADRRNSIRDDFHYALDDVLGDLDQLDNLVATG